MGVCACLALLTSVAVFGGSASGKAHSAATFKVGLVTDTGGLNDRSFNHLAYLGVQRAKAKLGVQVQVLTSKSDADYVPNLTTLAQQGYNLIIPVGFLMADATDTVAKAVPSSKFAVIDVDATTLKDKPKNVEGLIFKEQEAGYLAGYLAGLVAKAKGYKTISSVGGQKIPPVDHYIAGYQAGAKAADPGIKTLNGYSQDFAAQDKCKEIALNQIAKGSKVVFQVAGGCGLGALDAAKQKKLQGIGVDADQGYLGSYILTSAEKKVDVAVYNAIADALKGKFAAGKDRVNDIANGGVGYGKINAVGKPYQGKLVAIRKKIAKGQIKNIPDTVK
ncbi:MAG TPA: BMP family ABC transporter substrate-binding protein [Solirubrobacteraceae bacterium]|nr:BMP family ABC transporter substrate-binding protein [Solirubrobacteraceae bacterium]